MDGPVVRLCAPEAVPVVSKILGIPVRGDDPDGLHHESCGGCQGKADRTTCPYSIRLTRDTEENVDG